MEEKNYIEHKGKDTTTSNFNKILQMMSLNNFAKAFVAIFIPIYLIKLGYSFQMVMLWMIIQHVVLLITAFIAIFVSNRIGLVHSLHIRFLLVLTYFSLLIFGLKDNPALFYVIAILIGMETAFYWMPLNTLFIRNTTENNMGNTVSKFFVVPDILSIGSPLIGALIAIRFGFISLFSFAMFLLLFTFVPILSLRSEKSNFIFSWQKFLEIFNKNKQYIIPEIVDNITEDAMIVWSIFIYLKLMSTLQVGIIGTITAVASLCFTLIIGKITDKFNRHKVIKIAALFVSIAWVINFMVGKFIPYQWPFYIATVFVTLSLKAFLVPYGTFLYNKARKGDAQFVVLREVPVVLGRVILYGSAILFYNQLPILFLFIGIIFSYFWFLDAKKLE